MPSKPAPKKKKYSNLASSSPKGPGGKVPKPRKIMTKKKSGYVRKEIVNGKTRYYY